MPTVSETLRRAMNKSGESLYRISKESGISYPTIHGFYNNDRELIQSSIDRLANYLGYELVRRKGRKKASR